AGWTSCECGMPMMPGVVLDPFMGTGTTLKAAAGMNRSAIGVDLAPSGEKSLVLQTGISE
ncbi:MAG: site-specific DNA-methyltransferase, partial [Geobacteraceae bacterium]|nr:site-specific DNA-methyltransferase [Geobacteraceae bacterium]